MWLEHTLAKVGECLEPPCRGEVSRVTSCRSVGTVESELRGQAGSVPGRKVLASAGSIDLKSESGSRAWRSEVLVGTQVEELSSLDEEVAQLQREMDRFGACSEGLGR